MNSEIYHDLSVEQLKEELKFCSKEKYFHLRKSDEFSKNEKKIEQILKKKCKHTNTEKHRDSGPYPETHIFCKDCGLYL